MYKVLSPCIGICTLDETKSSCIGCLRTKDEITTWYRLTDEEKLKIITDIKNRQRPNGG